jgi:hypothetical protein
MYSHFRDTTLESLDTSAGDIYVSARFLVKAIQELDSRLSTLEGSSPTPVAASSSILAGTTTIAPATSIT